MNEIDQKLTQMFSLMITRHPHMAEEFERMSAASQGKKDYSKLNETWAEQEYILSNLSSFSADFYKKNKDVREIEHQVGRFLNMKQIAAEIMMSHMGGDIVEFGTWQGLALIVLEQCFRDDPIKRRLIGIDSFEGLPETSTVWEKGQFSDTSYETAKKNIESHIEPGRPFTLIKGWFSDPEVARKLYQVSNSICLVHFDADLASSTTEALTIIEPYLVRRTQPIYFLFDDWGCHQDEVPDAFLDWLEKARPKFGIRAEKLYTTLLTRYYRISPTP